MKPHQYTPTRLQIGMIRDWLRTPPGDWPETRQAFNRANNELPHGMVPSMFVHLVPLAEWHPDRRAE